MQPSASPHSAFAPVDIPHGAPGQPRVLLIEDDTEAADEVAQRLDQAGWWVRLAHDGHEGLALAVRGRFDVIVVDRMLPGLDGLSLTAQLRAGGLTTPILFVTAMGALSDRVAGLQGGGDDYLVKPYFFEELEARLSALARRGAAGAPPPTVLRTRDLELDRLGRRVRRAGREIDLLPLEFKLLECLMLHAGQPITRLMLLQQVWGFKFDPKTNIVETHISRLRAKLDQDGGAAIITTVRGAGYRVEQDA